MFSSSESDSSLRDSPDEFGDSIATDASFTKPELLAEERATTETLIEEIKKLKPKIADTLLLYYGLLSGEPAKTTEDIAKVLGITQQGAQYRINTGLDKLRKSQAIQRLHPNSPL